MGALHEGHLSLVKAAQQAADTVIVSIFVNPIQFGPNEDFAQYPRRLENDLHLLRQLGVSATFIPNTEEMFPHGFQTYVTNPTLSSELCGKTRQSHFQGVLTVLTKLFHLIRPNFAVFGKKDYQQLFLIQKMINDLRFNIEIIPAKIIREPDGLAMSSRNLRLTPEERTQATALFEALGLANQKFVSGIKDPQKLIDTMKEFLDQTPLRTEYIEIRNQKDLGLPHQQINEPCVCLAAAHLGNVRLIDNLELGE